MVSIAYPPDMMWKIMQQRPHHLLRCAANDGHKVYFGDATETVSYEAEPNITVINDWGKVPLDIDIIYMTSPWQYDLCREMKPKKVIYDCCDYRDGKDKELIRTADTVIVTSLGLKKMAAEYGRADAIYVSNACDFDHFNIDNNAAGDIVCYMGIVHPRVVDFTLMNKLSVFNLLYVGLIDAGRDVMLPFGRHLGHQDYSKLPDILKTAKVGIIPFRLDSGFTQYAAPIKVYEYLSAGLPVVSSPIPELVPLAERGLIRVVPTDDGGGWRRAIREAMEDYPNIDGKKWAKGQTWDNRWKQIRMEFLCH